MSKWTGWDQEINGQNYGLWRQVEVKWEWVAKKAHSVNWTTLRYPDTKLFMVEFWSYNFSTHVLFPVHIFHHVCPHFPSCFTLPTYLWYWIAICFIQNKELPWLFAPSLFTQDTFLFTFPYPLFFHLDTIICSTLIERHHVIEGVSLYLLSVSSSGQESFEGVG